MKNRPTKNQTPEIVSAKARLFTQVLPALKERSAYFSHKAIQAAVNEAELQIEDAVLNVYLTQATKQGLIHDAGRGWYSRLSEPVKLDVKLISKLVKTVEKAFPLLEFAAWSTAQINPWMHHLLAQPVAFLHAPREVLETLGEALRDQGWEVALNPGKREAAKIIRPGDKMVVLRPLHSKQPPPDGHQISLEQMLVELLDEAEALALMDRTEAEATVRKITTDGLLQIPVFQRFAEFKRVKIPELDPVN